MMQSQQNGIFVRTAQDIKKELRLASSVNITHLRVRGGILVAAINNRKILKLSVVNSDKPVEIAVPVSFSEELSYLHLSFCGKHCIASYASGENLYVNLKTKQCFPVRQIKGVLSAVGWSSEKSKDEETGPILIGTVKGAIYETNISNNGTLAYLKDMRWDMEKDSPICNLQLRLVNDDDPRNNRWMVLVCQPSRLYSVCGTVDTTQKTGNAPSSYVSSISLQSAWIVPTAPETGPQPVFLQLFAQKEKGLCTLESTSSTPSKWSYLAIHPVLGEPRRFVWLTGNSYTTGQVQLQAESPRDVLVEDKSTEMPRVEGSVEKAVGVSLTEYHTLIAFPNRVIATSIYNQAVVYEDIWSTEQHGSAVGLTFDPSSEFHWVYTSQWTMKYRPNDETRYVWRIMLERGEFTRAVVVARARMDIDPAAHDLVLRKLADKHMKDKNYIAAAEILAYSSEPFESVVMRFLSTEDDRRQGLKTLLEKKLDQFTRGEDVMKRDALIMWLLEVQLTEIAETRRGTTPREERGKELEKQLHTFLTRKVVQECIISNKEAVYQLVVSHGDFDCQLYLASMLKDWETVINIYLLRESYREALEVIKTQNRTSLYYKYAPSLVSQIPRELFKCLCGNSRLRPSALMSTLSQCQNDQKLAVEAVRYLEWAVEQPSGKGDVSLHNFLISMYAKFRPKQLQNYLEKHGKDGHSLPYDLEFAIRVTHDNSADRSTVFLYCVSELFYEATELALKIDVELAKECARWMNADDDDFLISSPGVKYPLEVRRRVWMKIASHIIRESGDAAAAIGLLKESGDVIKIQDILPFFPDFTKIQHFKEPLCECLKEHSAKIQNLQTAMKEATQTATEIRERTDRLKKRVTVVRAAEQCSGCQRPLFSRPFYSHSCRHFFHRDCLEDKMMLFLSPDERTRVAELLELERRLLQQLDAEDKMGNRGKQVHEKEQHLNSVSGKLTEILGSDCPLCGLIAIEQIDSSLFKEGEYEEDLATWVVPKGNL